MSVKTLIFVKYILSKLHVRLYKKEWTICMHHIYTHAVY